jgi:uncharacterized protein (UPF0303 family)
MTILAGWTLDSLLEEEEHSMLASLSERDAVELGTDITANAIRGSLSVAVEVWRGSRLVYRAACVGTNGHNDMYLADKRRVVERFGHSSLYERLRAAQAGVSYEELTSLPFPEYAAFGGGVPLVIKGTGQVGVAIVSGLAQEEDHALVMGSLRSQIADRP